MAWVQECKALPWKDVVFLYTDRNHATYSQYCLPKLPPTNPSFRSSVTVCRRHAGRNLPLIEEIPYSPREGEGVDFDVKVTEEEVESLKDEHSDIR